MNKVRANSSPELVAPPPLDVHQQFDDSALEGVAANVKLLLKLIQDHKNACNKETNDRRRMLRVATMMTILDNVRSRIQKCQSFGNKRPDAAAELRRCCSDLKPIHLPRDKKSAAGEPLDDEKERLKRELQSSKAAQKSLSAMYSSLGKEKAIMAIELSVKAHQLSEMEDLVNDLKKQNDKMVEKCAGKGEWQGNLGLRERNKELSEQLLRSLDGYRSMKRKLKEAEEENMAMREMGARLSDCFERIRGFKDCRVLSESLVDNVSGDDQIGLEGLFDCFRKMIIVKHDEKQGE